MICDPLKKVRCMVRKSLFPELCRSQGRIQYTGRRKFACVVAEFWDGSEGQDGGRNEDGSFD